MVDDEIVDSMMLSDEEIINLGIIENMLTPEEKAQKAQEMADELKREGFLPKNPEFNETVGSPQEEVEANPRQFIIEECIPACLELWSKNIYTFMVSDHENKGQCWIEVIADNLSEENRDIFMSLSGDDVIKFSYHKGTINFGVKLVGKKGQERLLELAKQFKMQDVPLNQAYISLQDFLINYCDCYDEISNPNYREMKPVWEMDLPVEEVADYYLKYDEWKDSIESKKTIKQFNPNKLTKPISEFAREHGVIIVDDRVYLSEFDYKKHMNYVDSLSNKSDFDDQSTYSI